MGALTHRMAVMRASGGIFYRQASVGKLVRNCFLTLCMILCGVLIIDCDAVTKSGDIQGLMAVKLAIKNHDNDFMQSWDDAVDPCSGSWRGVTCNCTTAQKEKPGTPLDCETMDETLEERVISLELGCRQCRTDAYKLNGTISPDLSRLDQLRYLDLSMNNLEGPLPNSLQELKELRFLSVSDNKLSGTLPSFIGDLVHLRELQLDSNLFSGSIPQDWCTLDFNVSKVIVHNNLGLCGTVPTCLQDDEVEEESRKIPLIERTFLRRSSTDSIGVCDNTPPQCPEYIGCKIGVPDFWTHFGKVQFYFYDLTDPESEVPEYSFELREDGSDIPVASAPIEPSDDMMVTKVVSYLKQNESIQANRTYVDFNITGFSLSQGANYTVTIIATNGAGPPMTTNFTSKLVLVDYTEPEGGALRIDLAPSEDAANLALSWTSFEDGESQVSSVSVQLKKMTEAGVVNVTQKVDVSTSQNSSEIDTLLEEDTVYKAVLYASNGAGLEKVTTSETFSVEESDKNSKSISMSFLILVIVGCLCLGFIMMISLVTYIGHQRKGLGDQEPITLKDFMYSLLDTGCDQPKHRPEVVNEHKEMAFVVTDLEGSTEMSNSSETSFKTLTVIHDQIMRNGIAAHAGYEINTEGDSFLVAFTSVVDAVLFCMETQYSLLDANWPYDVLRLPKCRIERTVDNKLVFRGPRVRMAIHWADEIVNKLHPTTKCRVFEGPGFELTKEIADAAHGGQVLLTHQAWLMLQNNMGIAGFPTIDQIGEFHVEQFSGLEEKTIWLYQVTQLAGKPLHRAFLPPRYLKKESEGWGFNIIQPPIPAVARPSLAFVAVRTVFHNENKELPAEVGEILRKVLSSMAQPFKGYIYSGNKAKGRALLSFARTSDAVRYSHAVQVSLLYEKWPDGIEQYVGPSVIGSNGFPIFLGPRLAIGIHYSKHYTAHPRGDGMPSHGQWLYYDGPGQMLVKELSKIANGGQVILSEAAWSSIQHRLPGQTQTISLGKHILRQGFTTPQLLMEVLPEILKAREFEDLATEKKLEPGYRDSPPETQNVAIVFAKAVKPKDAHSAEQREGTESSTDAQSAMQVLTDYLTSVDIFSQLVRKWLPKYNGYECKEPEAGKLTLAFWDVDEAIKWCAHVQLELLQQDWPAGLLNMDGCGEVYSDTGELLRKGLRVRMGMAYGLPGMKKPLSSGRADYFGHIPNLAARVSSLAAPGQILVECSPGFGDKVSWLEEGKLGLISFESSRDESSVGNALGAIQLQELGQYYLKGFDDNLKLIYQALPLSLLKREYEMEPAAIRVADGGRLMSLRSEPIRLAIKRKRDFFSRIRVGWLLGYFENVVGVHSLGNKTSIRSSPTERESSSTLAANSQQHLFPSPRIFSGSPQVLGQIEVGRLGMTSTNCLVPSPGPSVANLDDLSLESHGSWGDSVYHCHSRSGSGVSVTSRGQSSTWRSPPDASPSPPLAETPFFRQPDTIVPAEEEPSTSMSLRHLRGLGDMLPCKDSLKEWEPGRLDQRESNDSIVSAKSQRSYVQDLANLWVSRFRGSEQTDTSRDTGPSGAGFEFNFPIVDTSHNGPASTRAISDVESQLDVEGLRAASAPEFRCEGWLSGFGDAQGGLQMAEACRCHLLAQSRSVEIPEAESDTGNRCRKDQV